jgi:hypothetical protein
LAARYRFGGAQKALAIGVDPDVGLKQARDARQGAKRLLSSGVDPMAARKQAKVDKASASTNTFEALSSELWTRNAERAKLT